MMNAYDQAVFLQKALHNLPEASGQEQKTKAVLMEFLKGVQGLTVVDKGAWFYAVHREPIMTKITLMLNTAVSKKERPITT